MGPFKRPPLNLPALGRRQPLYLALRLEQRPVFLLNSRLGLFTAASINPWQATDREAPLLPKLRGHVAEFLNEGSPDHLWVLTLAYQCRFAVRAPGISLEAFPGSGGGTQLPLVTRGLPIVPEAMCLGDLPPRRPWTLRRGNSSATLREPICVPPLLITSRGGTGILTRCPSPTPYGLGLGPTNPPSINVAEETLGFRCPGFAPGFSATHAGIRTSRRSSRSYDRPSQRPGTLPYPARLGEQPQLRYQA